MYDDNYPSDYTASTGDGNSAGSGVTQPPAYQEPKSADSAMQPVTDYRPYQRNGYQSESSAYGGASQAYGQGEAKGLYSGQSAAWGGSQGETQGAYSSQGAAQGCSAQGTVASQTYSSQGTAGSQAYSAQGASQTYGGQSTSQGYGSQGAWQGSAGSYQYGNAYGNQYQSYAQAEPKKEKKRWGKTPKEKKPGGWGKRALAAVAIGLCFGLFAGLGLYAAQTASGLLVSKGVITWGQSRVEAPASAEAAAGTKDAAKSADAAKTADTAKTTDAAKAAKETTTVAPTLSQRIEGTAVVTDVSEVVKQVMPSIVAVNNHYTDTTSYWGRSFSNEADSSGSGIIVGQNDSELLIVTNYHVVQGTDKLTVQFTEDSEAEAFIKGQDAKMDLAVIAVPITEVSASTLKAISVATLGDSDALVVGEPAIAIGNSLGYGQSVTTGVISALNRTIGISTTELGYGGGEEVEGTFIQTDAAINPGNSGGALLNIRGEVIGINSNKIGGSAIEGMGYAIPISSASPIIAELMLKETKSKVSEEERGYLGISGISVTADVSQAYGMPEGVYIAQVYPGTAAAAAGLKQGDIIVSFDGDDITSMEELQKELEFYAKGSTVKVKIMTMTVTGYVETTVDLTLGNKVTE